jgi:hypothetical protein
MIGEKWQNPRQSRVSFINLPSSLAGSLASLLDRYEVYYKPVYLCWKPPSSLPELIAGFVLG